MKAVEFMEHKGHKILRVGFEGPLTIEQIKIIIDQAKIAIGGQPFDSVRLMTVLGETRFDPEIAGLFRTYVAFNKPYIKASAVVGATGLRKVALNAMSYATHRQITICQSEEEAKEYLASIG